MEKFGIIIDGYSSGKFYPEYFRSHEIVCLHIQSKVNIPEFVKGCFCSGSYKDTFINENFEETVNWIKDHGKPSFIIPGCEIGVNLADKLSDQFNLTLRNPLATSEARRDKYLMQEKIKSAGLRSIKQEVFQGSDKAAQWIQANQVTYPLVVKPLHSTSGDGFHLCKNEGDVEKAFEIELNRENLLNIQNTSLLVQEFIEGTEYVIDTVSLQGEITVTDIIKYQKRIGKYGGTIYERCIFMDTDNPEMSATIEYTKKILNALQIYNGPAHTEIIVDKKGPVLIETGSRPAGCMLDLDFIRNAYGHNQLELSGLLYADSNAYTAATKEINKKIKKPSFLVLYSQVEAGVVKSIDFSKVENSDVHVKTDLQIAVGKYIDEPKNLSEAHAIVYLQGDEKEMDKLSNELINSPQQFVELN